MNAKKKILKLVGEETIVGISIGSAGCDWDNNIKPNVYLREDVDMAFIDSSSCFHGNYGWSKTLVRR